MLLKLDGEPHKRRGGQAMMPLRRASAIAALCVLAAAATASAECAWVLWQRITPEGTNPGLFEVLSSYPGNTMQAQGITLDIGHQQCLKDRETTLTRIFALQAALGVKQNAWVICLPDTVDPRGPKGGTR
jgi:hypothetical protein